jgi:hypothetical protein
MRHTKRVLVVLIGIFAAISSIMGNLGDGYDKVEDSYRNLVKRKLHDDGTVGVLYQKDRYFYLVIFAGGRSVSESYSHVKGGDLSQNEITRFLKRNAGGGTWREGKTPKGRRFKRSDERAEATYASVDGRPTLTVRELGPMRRDQ